MQCPIDRTLHLLPLTPRSVIAIIVTEERPPRHHLAHPEDSSILPASFSSTRFSSVSARSIPSTLARDAARAAMDYLCATTGIPRTSDTSIGKGSRGEPLFPNPFRGSLAHTSLASCALVTLDREILTVGIDLEQHTRPIRSGILQRITTPTEYQSITEWQHDDSSCSPAWRSGLAIFCAKEAAVKALSPLSDYLVTLRAVPLRYTPSPPEWHIPPSTPMSKLGSFTLLDPTAYPVPLDGAVFLWQNLVIATARTSGNTPDTERAQHVS